jgi:hypothetical protein
MYLSTVLMVDWSWAVVYEPVCLLASVHCIDDDGLSSNLFYPIQTNTIQCLVMLIQQSLYPTPNLLPNFHILISDGLTQLKTHPNTNNPQQMSNSSHHINYLNIIQLCQHCHRYLI